MVLDRLSGVHADLAVSENKLKTRPSQGQSVPYGQTATEVKLGNPYADRLNWVLLQKGTSLFLLLLPRYIFEDQKERGREVFLCTLPFSHFNESGYG